MGLAPKQSDLCKRSKDFSNGFKKSTDEEFESVGLSQYVGSPSSFELRFIALGVMPYNAELTAPQIHWMHAKRRLRLRSNAELGSVWSEIPFSDRGRPVTDD